MECCETISLYLRGKVGTGQLSLQSAVVPKPVLDNVGLRTEIMSSHDIMAVQKELTCLPCLQQNKQPGSRGHQ